ncbi:MAG: hybrid sensor histidine kinase/response regulator [Pirellulaceae bacterium]|nr:hybrid sensor histidine kinase/response regulator [Pirellulaceae bacterium]
MSGSNALLELFREEVRANVQVLNDGLVALEKQPGELRQIEPLMRAAHSVKGAARVVNIDAAVKLAHAAEDCLVAAQDGRITLATGDIDALLQAADLLAGIAENVGPNLSQWLAASSQEIENLSAVLRERAQGRGTPVATPAPAPVEPSLPSAPAADAPAAPAAPPALDTPEAPDLPDVTDATQAPGEAVGTDATEETDGTISTKAVLPHSGPSPAPAVSAGEQVVRVTAQSLSRLMGLAGESLVEARWLQPFSKSLLELKRQQTLLADRLEELHRLLPRDESGDRPAEVLAEASERLAECRRMLAAQIGEFEQRARNADELNSRLYHEVIASRMRPFRDGVQGFPRLVRDLARQLGKQVEFQVRGELTDVDRDILEKLESPLNHILRNALDHGLEAPAERLAAGKLATGRLELEARHNAGMLVITVRDDGRGIDTERIRRKVIERRLADASVARDLSAAELLEFLFLPAFSTAAEVTEVSGRGVGLDVVHSTVHSVGGSVRVQSRLGAGTTFMIELPITLSVIRAVLVLIAGEPYALPHNRVDRLVRLPRGELHALEHRQHFELDGRHVGIVMARQLLELDGEAEEDEDDELHVVLFSHQADPYGLVVDRFCLERDLVVRPLDPRLGKVPNISAAAILDDGSPVLIVDVDDLRRAIERKLHDPGVGRAAVPGERQEQAMARRILVVDDSMTVREVQRQLLLNHGYEVELAVDGMEGWNTLARGQFDLVITDVDMPRFNGIELVRKIKGDARLRATPVIIVSYKDREEDRLRGMEAGADYYLTKSSIHDDTLLSAVRNLIGESRG